MRGAVPSIAVHAAIVLVAVHATAHAAISHEQPAHSPTIHYVPTIRPAPTERTHAPTDRARAGAPPVGPVFRSAPTTWPTTIPDRIPTIDPSHGALAISNSEFGHGVAPASPFGSDNAVSGSAPLSASDVERPVSPIGGPPTPAYPEALRSSGIRGSVTAEFVVDTTGHVEAGSFRPLGSDNDLFTTAVRAAVLRTRFHPAEAGGRRVRQLVQESFSFVLR